MSQSIERAVAIIQMLSQKESTPSEIARRLGVHRSTALRIMETLLKTNFLRKLPDGNYCIGAELLSLAHQAQDQFYLAKIAHPKLVELSRDHEKTVHLAELQNNQIIYIDKIEPQRSIRLTSRIGQAVCLHTASVAKVILAFLPPEVRDELLANYVFETFTPTTIQSREALEEELKKVFQRGWATDDGERENYINSIGLPIRDASGNVVAALSAVELKVISNLDEMHHLMFDCLQETALSISKQLGWHG